MRIILSFLILMAAVRCEAVAQRLLTGGGSSGFRSYQSGETLCYNVGYGFIKGGECRFSVTDTVIGSKTLWHIVCGGFTTGLPDVFFKVRDTYESYVDQATELPDKAVRNIREGRYRYYDEIVYDRDSNQVHTIKKGTQPVPDGIYDVVSAFYHARNNTFNDDLQTGDTIYYVTYFAGEIYPLRIKYRGLDVVKTDFGKVECYKFSPITEVGRSFKTEDDMQVWISRDDNRLPIAIRFNLVVGSFYCELSRYQGLKYPLKTVK